MAKKKRRKAQVAEPIRQIPARAVETRTAETLTVAWMMAVLVALLCGTFATVLTLVLRGREVSGSPLLFAALLHFCAAVGSVLSLALLPLVLKTRQVPPPAAITWGSAIIALLALGAAILL